MEKELGGSRGAAVRYLVNLGFRWLDGERPPGYGEDRPEEADVPILACQRLEPPKADVGRDPARFPLTSGALRIILGGMEDTTMTTTITYQEAYRLWSEWELCSRHDSSDSAALRKSLGIGPLGPVSRGAHHGTCEVCWALRPEPEDPRGEAEIRAIRAYRAAGRRTS